MSKDRKNRGQATVEYVLVMAMIALFGLFFTRFFLDTFTDGLIKLSENIAKRVDIGTQFEL